MAKKVPPRNKAKTWQPKPGEGLIEWLIRTGPHNELADAIEKVYEKRHRGFTEGPRGRSKRRPSTPTSSSK